eukprot:scaffold86940_cov63-Phaeocystis_antarctica.AAC.2
MSRVARAAQEGPPGSGGDSTAPHGDLSGSGSPVRKATQLPEDPSDDTVRCRAAALAARAGPSGRGRFQQAVSRGEAQVWIGGKIGACRRHVNAEERAVDVRGQQHDVEPILVAALMHSHRPASDSARMGDARGPSAGGGARVLKKAFGTAREQPFVGPRVVRIRERLAIDALQRKLQLEPALVSCRPGSGLGLGLGLGSG